MRIIITLIVLVGIVVWVFILRNSKRRKPPQNTRLHENAIKLSDEYRYKPETAGKGYFDEVIFKKPDIIKIERHFEDGHSKYCLTQINTSIRGGNAWTAEDVQLALKKKGIAKLWEKGGGIVQLQKTMDGEGSQQEFILSGHGKTIKVLPPNSNEVADTKADEDIIEMVYVLSKVYRQQLMHSDCESLIE